MRWMVCLLCACVVAVHSAPAPSDDKDYASTLPLQIQEALQKLHLAEQNVYIEDASRDKRNIAIIKEIFPGLSNEELNSEKNQIAQAESQNNEVRVQYSGEAGAEESDDQDQAASGGNETANPGNEDSETDESDPRNKRLINFGFGASTGGSSGGSGNFLFDIIRLVAGSGNAEPSADHTAGVTAEAAAEKDDGYQAGVPGPITRLFVIANRGIANLIQDLILRLAQTSERIVNFKARLITSII